MRIEISKSLTEDQTKKIDHLWNQVYPIKWFSILVSAENQNKGYGRMLIDSLKQGSRKLCGWVIDHNNDLKQDGSNYYTPIQFYLKNGFIATEERIETDIISAVKIKFEA